MTSISMSDLEANLPHYIREVRHGSEFEVLDRGTPVARITSPVTSGGEAWDALIKDRVLTQGN